MAMAEAATGMAEPILVKRHAGQRLYNTAGLSYVTLPDLSDMVLARRRFIVRDAETGNDITKEILDRLQ
jgi:polyhydroxyalkanoate synthesis regulator protein